MRRSRYYSRFAGGQERGLTFCLIDLTASRPIQPRAVPLLRRALPRPDPPVVCPGFGFDRSTGFDKVTTCALEETMDLRPFGKSAGFGKDGFDICSRETMDLAKKTPLLDMPLKKIRISIVQTDFWICLADKWAVGKCTRGQEQRAFAVPLTTCTWCVSFSG